MLFSHFYSFNVSQVHLLLSIMERANAHARNVATIMPSSPMEIIDRHHWHPEYV